MGRGQDLSNQGEQQFQEANTVLTGGTLGKEFQLNFDIKLTQTTDQRASVLYYTGDNNDENEEITNMWVHPGYVLQKTLNLFL